MPLQRLRRYNNAWEWLNGPVFTPPEPEDPFTLRTTKPSEYNTGYRIPFAELTPYVGDYIITTPNITVSGLFVSGRILIRAANVTVEDCYVLATQTYTGGTQHLIDTQHSSARNAIIQFNTVSSQNNPGAFINGIGPKFAIAYRNNLGHVVDPFSIADVTGNNDNISIHGNYVHDLFYWTPAPHSDNRTHNDGIQSQGGPTNLYVVGNFINGKDSPFSYNGGSASGNALSCIMLNTNAARYKTNVLIEDNWLNGGGDTINGRGTDGGTITIRRNRFGADRDFFPITNNITLSSIWVVPTTGPDVNYMETTNLPINKSATFTQSSGTQTIRRYYA